jgi:hypothetical protein
MFSDDDLPDPDDISLGEPHNESYGAITAMLSEHMIDAERTNRWLLGLMFVAIDHCDLSELDIGDALSLIPEMTHADRAQAGFDAMNTLVGAYRRKGQRVRRTQR